MKDIRSFFTKKPKTKASLVISSDDDEELPVQEKLVKVDPNAFFSSTVIKQKKNTLVKVKSKENEVNKAALDEKEASSWKEKVDAKEPFESTTIKEHLVTTDLSKESIKSTIKEEKVPSNLNPKITKSPSKIKINDPNKQEDKPKFKY
jgi:hypothetical protein